MTAAVRLYFLEWDNGLEWDDHEATLLGVFTTAAKRAAARRRYEEMLKAACRAWPFATEGSFVEWEVTADDSRHLPGEGI